MRGLFRFLWSVLLLACAGIIGGVGYFEMVLPEDFSVTEGESVAIGDWVQETVATDGPLLAANANVGSQYRTQLKFLGLFPIKEVAVSVVDTPTVMVCGTPFGIKLYTEGVLVVGLSDVTTVAGDTNPAAAAGVCIGDTILSIDGKKVQTSRDVSQRVNECEGRPLTLRLRRDGVEFDATFTPVRPVDETGYRAGLWVRDSTAGIGILTFYDPKTGAFGGLGHPVCDTDTGTRMAISGGEIVPAAIYEVTKSVTGDPGELCGGFEEGSLGKLLHNGEEGLFGQLTAYPPYAISVPMAMKQTVKAGAAQIYTTIEGDVPGWYDVEIQLVHYSASATRNMVVKVTDPKLLEKTGGIVQGMSGSPIIQDGKLVGAITHVLVDDPTRGYGIFAENMLEAAQKTVEKNKLKEIS